MKKILIGLVSLIVIAYVGLQIADKVVKGGDDYYVQITTDGQRIEEKDTSGNTYVDYSYSLPGYDKAGNKKCWISMPQNLVLYVAKRFLKLPGTKRRA